MGKSKQLGSSLILIVMILGLVTSQMCALLWQLSLLQKLNATETQVVKRANLLAQSFHLAQQELVSMLQASCHETKKRTIEKITDSNCFNLKYNLRLNQAQSERHKVVNSTIHIHLHCLSNDLQLQNQFLFRARIVYQCKNTNNQWQLSLQRVLWFH